MSLPLELQQAIAVNAARGSTAAGSAMKLRPYQDEAIAAIFGCHEDGVQRPLLVCATGTGKTVMFCELARRVAARAHHAARVLIIAHRDELIDQAAKKVVEVWPAANVGILKAARGEVHAEVCVASIQTLARPKRMASYLAAGPPDLVIVDEAHHAGADSYFNTLVRLGCFTVGGPLCVGVTATPQPKNRALARVWQRVAYEYDMGRGVDEGYLSNLIGVQVLVDDLDLTNVKRSKATGDFDAGALGEAMSDAHSPQIVAQALLDEAPGRKSLVFVPTIALAHETAAAMKAAGIRAVAISGETEKDDTEWVVADSGRRRYRPGELLHVGETVETVPGRTTLYAQLRRGDIDSLVNAQLLTEGFDEPSVDAVVVARPTQSRTMYVQMVGRGTRLFPGKDDCLVIDLMGASRKHSLLNLGALLGKEGTMRVNMREERERDAVAREADMEYEQQRMAIELRTKRVQLLAAFTWTEVDRGYAMSLPDGGVLAILMEREGDDDSWCVGIVRVGAAPNERLAECLTLEYAQGLAEDHAREVGAGRLRGKDQAWRYRPANAAQLDGLRRRGIPVPEGDVTSGQASDMIAAHTVTLALQGRRAA